MIPGKKKSEVKNLILDSIKFLHFKDFTSFSQKINVVEPQAVPIADLIPDRVIFPKEKYSALAKK